MKLRKAKIENNKYLYDEVDIPANKWTTVAPWAIETNVFIQDFDGNVSFGWVDSRVEQNSDGAYRITGLEGGNGKKAIKYWMPIQLPHDDFANWHSEYIEDMDFPKKEGAWYLVCIEKRAGTWIGYDLQLARWQKSGWHDSNVIAWREIPRAKK